MKNKKHLLLSVLIVLSIIILPIFFYFTPSYIVKTISAYFLIFCLGGTLLFGYLGAIYVTAFEIPYESLVPKIPRIILVLILIILLIILGYFFIDLGIMIYNEVLLI